MGVCLEYSKSQRTHVNPKEHIKSVQEWAEACDMSEVRMKHIGANKNASAVNKDVRGIGEYTRSTAITKNTLAAHKGEKHVGVCQKYA
ncbi:hypothetical protein GCM10008014_01580 [Paenibacillus silvae]|uniref:Uncharacterized protein n=1 Tax=Paenibacillus silvae TaxID=1325358 RepID=A0ABQ1YXR6_9BACL|nr:hypothetical protein GCM10008014_01580 [Paenibacillus silvae]